MLLNRTLDAVMPFYRELFARYNLTEQQWRVLRVVWSNDNVTSSQLSERTLLSAPSLVTIIDRMEKKQLVKRKRSNEDRRQTFIVATKKSRALEEEVIPQVNKIQHKIENCVTTQEWLSLEQILNKFNDGMYAKSSDSAVQKKAI